MKKEKLNQNRENSTAGNRAALNEMEENPAAEAQPGEQITEQELKAQRAARRKKRAEAKRKKEKQIRMRKNIFKLLFLAAGLAIVFFAVGIHRRNVKEREAALAEAKRIEEEQAAYEATRKKAEEEQAALEASRKKAEEEQAGGGRGRESGRRYRKGRSKKGLRFQGSEGGFRCSGGDPERVCGPGESG